MIIESPKILISETGSSILEIVVALGLLAFLCLAVGEVTNKSMLAQKTVNGAGTFNEVLSTAGLILLGDSTCSKALAGLIFDPTNTAGTPITINLPSGTPLVSDHMITADNTIQFSAPLLVPISNLPTQTVVVSTVPTAITITLANLVLNGTRLGRQLGSPLISGTISNIPIATAPDHTIQYCAGLTNTSAYDICTSQSTNPKTPGLCPVGSPPIPSITCITGTACP